MFFGSARSREGCEGDILRQSMRRRRVVHEEKEVKREYNWDGLAKRTEEVYINLVQLIRLILMI